MDDLDTIANRLADAREVQRRHENLALDCRIGSPEHRRHLGIAGTAAQRVKVLRRKLTTAGNAQAEAEGITTAGEQAERDAAFQAAIGEGRC